MSRHAVQPAVRAIAADQRRIGLRHLRRAVGAAIAISGALILLGEVIGAARLALESSAALRAGVGASLVAGLATGIGALPVYILRRVEGRVQGILFALAGGLMLGAAAFGLLLPAMRLAGGDGWLAISAGIALGVTLVALIDKLLPHLHAMPEQSNSSALWRSTWLLVVAIGIHNLPEGLAVGASFQGSVQLPAASAALGWTTAIGIGVQNLPEGLIVAMALVAAGASRSTGVAVATLTGLFEPLGALIGGAAAGLSAAFLPAAMALAAGAMVFVVMHEVLPNAAKHLPPGLRTAIALAGAGTMAALTIV